MRAQNTCLSTGRVLLVDSHGVGLMTLEQFRASSKGRLQLRVHPFHEGGWVVLLNYRGLATQRGQLRVFRTMDALCNFMNEEGLKVFEVNLTVLTLRDCDRTTWQPATLGGAE
jgi:hypothetical protein